MHHGVFHHVSAEYVELAVHTLLFKINVYKIDEVLQARVAGYAFGVEFPVQQCAVRCSGMVCLRNGISHRGRAAYVMGRRFRMHRTHIVGNRLHAVSPVDRRPAQKAETDVGRDSVDARREGASARVRPALDVAAVAVESVAGEFIGIIVVVAVVVDLCAVDERIQLFTWPTPA